MSLLLVLIPTKWNKKHFANICRLVCFFFSSVDFSYFVTKIKFFCCYVISVVKSFQQFSPPPPKFRMGVGCVLSWFLVDKFSCLPLWVCLSLLNIYHQFWVGIFFATQMLLNCFQVVKNAGKITLHLLETMGYSATDLGIVPLQLDYTLLVTRRRLVSRRILCFWHFSLYRNQARRARNRIAKAEWPAGR